MTRVAITGLGVISALGGTASEFWAALQDGRSGIRPIRSVDCSALRFHNGSEVPGYDARAYFDGAGKTIDRFAQFAIVAAREAVGSAAIDWTPELCKRTAIVTGSCAGGLISEDAVYWEIYKLEHNRVHPMTIPRVMANAGASHLSIEFGITGPVLTTSTACSSSTHAIGQAFWMLRSGIADLALAGGSEAPFSYCMLRAWDAMRVVSPTTCRPFSKDRDGMVLGEGGAMLVLEPVERAQARGAHVYAEIVGFGLSADAASLLHPDVEGAAQCMRAALSDAGVQPEQIGYINAHGTGTRLNDATETAAVRAAFGAHADRLLVSSTKSMHGHALGAAGALEAAATALALGSGVLPPTANYNEPDPQCDLDVIPNRARTTQVEYALSNSFAFGGLNAALVLKKV